MFKYTANVAGEDGKIFRVDPVEGMRCLNSKVRCRLVGSHVTH